MAALMVPRVFVSKAVLSSAFRGLPSVRHGSVSVPNPWFFDDGRNKKFKNIPGPRALPIAGIVWKYYLGKYRLEDMPSIYEGYMKEYGPLVKERFYYGRTLIHVFDPLDMNKIYFMDRVYDPYRKSHQALDAYRQSRPEMYSNGGLASTNGEQWRNLRNSFGSKFLNEQSNEAFELITDDLVASINSGISANKDSNDVVLLPKLYHWSLECLGVVALGQRLGCFEKDYDKRLDQFLECIYHSQRSVFHTENLPRPFTRKYARQLAKCQDYIHMFLWPLVNEVVLKEFTEKDIAENKYNPVAKNKSVAYALLKKELLDRDIRTLITDMFQGGIHSTAHVLAFALYHLAQNPEIQKDVRASLIETFPNPTDKISSKDLNQKIKNVIRETMRLNPSTIGTGRVLPERLILSNYQVPEGTLCILHHQIASKQEKYFESPELFNPYRYDNPDISKEAFVANSPFAMGRRACPGRIIALNEIAIALSKILRLFELSYKHESVGTRNCLINVPDKEIKITFTPTTEMPRIQ